ncbi:DEAD/DEAH box helicase [Candidatus Mycoplasma mahonii]|uniref:DEAD/DEAH box helicase n=1 Tax=Candidatus Mycoplasma mahonii TaxID=3004105 RepID=UPI0026EE3501|nr:DEAD/DEAH box helicase [Candidatus Mycoplasma mahonii]WKX02371.1 DEAD/DEAH box helicase [Candidatus Mycoplasma mahonii]
MNNLVNKIILLDFDVNLQQKSIVLVKQANKKLIDTSTHIFEKDVILCALNDFSSISDLEKIIPITDMRKEDLFTTLHNVKMNKHQKKFIELLRDEKNYSISCPTSFGKSFLIRLLVKDLYKKINKKMIIVVPTNALANEYHQQLLKSEIPNSTLPIVDEKVKVLTQEKAYQEKISFGDIIFMDEAYEMINTSSDRNILLAKLLKKVVDCGARIKLISPNIKNPITIIPKSISDNFISEIFTYDITSRDIELIKKENMIEKIKIIKNSIIYCNKKSSFNLSNKIKKYSDINLENEYKGIFKWIRDEYGTNEYIHLLKVGIVIHNGDVPKPIRIIQEALFKANKAEYMFATTTVTQGVNLKANSLFIYEEIGKSKFTNFNFRNLIGRVGRYSVKDFESRNGTIYASDDIDKIDSLFDVKNKILIDIDKTESTSLVAETSKDDLLYDGTKTKTLIDYYIEGKEKKTRFRKIVLSKKDILMHIKDLKNPSDSFLDIITNLSRLIYGASEIYIKRDIERLIYKYKPTVLWEQYKYYLEQRSNNLEKKYKSFMFSGANKENWSDLDDLEKSLYKTCYISFIARDKEKTKSIINKVFILITLIDENIVIPTETDEQNNGLPHDFIDTTISNGEYDDAVTEIKEIIKIANK